MASLPQSSPRRGPQAPSRPSGLGPAETRLTSLSAGQGAAELSGVLLATLEGKGTVVHCLSSCQSVCQPLCVSDRAVCPGPGPGSPPIPSSPRSAEQGGLGRRGACAVTQGLSRRVGMRAGWLGTHTRALPPSCHCTPTWPLHTSNSVRHSLLDSWRGLKPARESFQEPRALRRPVSLCPACCQDSGPFVGPLRGKSQLHHPGCVCGPRRRPRSAHLSWCPAPTLPVLGAPRDSFQPGVSPRRSRRSWRTGDGYLFPQVCT